MTNITANAQPVVSAIVPARNEEATIAQCVESLAQQPEITEIIVVNDQSTDRTAEIVQELIRSYPQVRLLESAPLPASWVGKNHAVWQGSRAAKGAWLLFTDADVIHEKNSVSRALQIAGVQTTEKSGTAIPGCALVPNEKPQLVSFSPEQITETWYEKSLIPVIYCRLATKFDFDEVNDPHNKAAAANGQFLLISRAAYDAIGGHAAIASEVLEDVALAKLAKQSGHRISFGNGKGFVRVRMYRTFAAMWEGWKKNLYRLMGSHPKPLISEITRAISPILAALVAIAFVWGFTKDWRAGLFAAAVAFAAWHSNYRRELVRNQFSARLTWFGTAGKLLYAAVLWASYRAHQKGSLAWKGREYPVGTPSASKR